MRTLFALFFMILIGSSLLAESLWKDRNIYVSGQNLAIGDTVVVYVNDITRLRFTLNMQDKSNSSVSSNPDASLTGFLPKVAADKTSNSNNTINVDGKGDLAVKIASSITQQLPNGTYNIQGVKEVVFNGVSNRFTISGNIDPKLMTGRSINSEKITNFRLDIETTKQTLGINIVRPALQPNETAKSELTEQEKQQLIIDYLRKMLSELSR